MIMIFTVVKDHLCSLPFGIPLTTWFFFFFLVYKVLWGKVKCVYTQSDDKFCHSKVLVEWF